MRMLMIVCVWLGAGSAMAQEVPALGSYKPAGPTYEEYDVQSQYVTMRDKVRLAVDVLLPKGLENGQKIPSLVYLTSFWRSVEVMWPFNKFHEPDALQVFFVRHGYAVVLVDVRGTGASFGSRLYPWHADEIADGGEIVDWVVKQPWSDGTVGSFGAGYEGTAAELLTVPNRPAVKAVMPMYSEFDTYLETAFPGGIFNDWFVKRWSNFNDLMGRNVLPKEVGRLARAFAKGVSPVAGKEGGERLAEAIVEHEKNLDLYQLARNVVYRDTVLEVGDASGSIDDFTTFRRRAEIEAGGVPMFAWGSWLNGASADSVIRRFQTYKAPVRGIIGPWNKFATQNASPYAKSVEPVPGLDAQRMECLRFFDEHLRGAKAGSMPNKILIYYTMGAERWRATPVWPPKGTVNQRWYLAGGQALSPKAPEEEKGADFYRVDYSATTGESNRWHSHLLGAEVSYPDRAEQDAKLLTYTGPPLEGDTEITGHPVVTLYVTSTATDGAIYVYLEEVAPDGRVTYLAEGQIRAIHRKVSEETPPYTVAGPYHTFEEKDGMPLIPGEAAEVSFALLPVSVVVPKGHRIRIAIAGHDADTFARIPAEGGTEIIVGRFAGRASWVELPVVRGGGSEG